MVFNPRIPAATEVAQLGFWEEEDMSFESESFVFDFSIVGSVNFVLVLLLCAWCCTVGYLCPTVEWM